MNDPVDKLFSPKPVGCVEAAKIPGLLGQYLADIFNPHLTQVDIKYKYFLAVKSIPPRFN